METRAELLNSIHMQRGILLGIYIKYIHCLDAKDAKNWAIIVSQAREAGLSKEQLCKELSCAWSTVLRWEAGYTAPGPFAREAIKDRLLNMLDALAKKSKPKTLLSKKRGGESSRVTWRGKSNSLPKARHREVLPIV